MECFEDGFGDEHEQDDETPADPRLARRLARSKQRRARRALALARAGVIVKFPTFDGWGPRWAA